MKPVVPTMHELLSVYARLYLDTIYIVRLIREAGLTNIFPANLVRSEPSDSQRLAVAMATPAGLQYAVFEKDGSYEWWNCLNITLPQMSSQSLIEYAGIQAKYLPSGIKMPEPNINAVWEIYLSNYPKLSEMMTPLISDPNIRIYPWVFHSPETGRPTELIVERSNGEGVRVWPENGGENSIFYVYLPKETIMTSEELIAFALS